jgi:hypothetical protein
MRVFLVLLVGVALAGCFGSSEADEGELAVTISDNAESPVVLILRGAWAHQAGGGNGSWFRLAPEGSQVELDGKGDNVSIAATIPAASYDRVRLLFSAIKVDGSDVVLSEDGIDLPVPVEVVKGGQAEIRFAFDWTEALYPSANGTAFLPVLQRLDVAEGGEVVGSLERKDISGTGTKPPAARMRMFDSKGLQMYESDFVADSPVKRVVGTSGNLSFTASPSEAVEPGAELVSFAWDFGDGGKAEGLNVEHAFPLKGGNFTIRLVVTDSMGASDPLVVKVALLPALVTETLTFSGRTTGAAGTPRNMSAPGSPAGEGEGLHRFGVEVETTLAGEPALGITQVLATLRPEGSLAPGTDLDLRLTDGKQAQIGTSYTDSSSESFVRSYEIGGSQPGPGTWTAEARPDPAVDAPYHLTVSITWQLSGDPGFVEWASNYDDGHSHQH